VSEQEQRASNGHESVSNVPEEPSEAETLSEGQEVSEPPFTLRAAKYEKLPAY